MPAPPPPKHSQFKPGQSGNPLGNVGSLRQKLEVKFLRALKDDFEANGEEALKKAREEKPADYLRVVASMMPKQIEHKHPIGDMSDEQLRDALVALQAWMATRAAEVEQRASTVQ
jgi:hypothetical protein